MATEEKNGENNCWDVGWRKALVTRKNSPQVRKPGQSNAQSWHWESVNADLEIKSDELREMLT